MHYKIAIILSLLIGMLTYLPTYLSVNELGAEYKGIPYIYQDAEDVYIARTKEVLEGHIFISQPYLFEGKDGAVMQLPYGEMLYAYTVKLISFFSTREIDKNLNLVFYFSKFFLPALLCFLIFIFIINLLGKEDKNKYFLATSVSVSIVLGFELADLNNLKNILLFKDVQFYLSIWTRMVNPITGALLLFITLICVLKINNQNKVEPENKNIINTSVIFATFAFALSSGYFFSFAYIAVILGLMFLYYLYLRDFTLAKKYFLIIVGGLVLNSFYLYNILHSIVFKVGGSDPLKTGLIHSHLPIFNSYITLSLLLLTFISILFYRKYIELSLQTKNNLILLFTINIASYIALNQHVITGSAIWPDHFVQYTVPVCFITVFYIAYIFLAKINLYFKYFNLQIAFYIIVVVFVFFAAIKNIQNFTELIPKFTDIQKYSQIQNYFENRDNKSDTCVILLGDMSIDHGIRIIPTVTHCDVYMTHYVYMNINNEQIFDRYLAHLRINDIKPENLEKHWAERPTELNYLFYKDWGGMFRLNQNKWLARSTNNIENDTHMSEVKNRIIEEYKNYYKMSSADFFKTLKKYKLTHIVIDKEYNSNNVNLNGNINSSIFALATTTKNFEIWEVK